MTGFVEVGPGLKEYGRDWEQFRESSYALYYADFYDTKPTWPVAGVRFAIKRHPEKDNKCATFWHIVTEGSDEANRTIVESRCERISWPRTIINEFAEVYPSHSSANIVWWKSERHREPRYVIALSDFSYVVVIADRGSYVLLWTAYPVEAQHRRTKLHNEYLAYWKPRP